MAIEKNWETTVVTQTGVGIEGPDMEGEGKQQIMEREMIKSSKILCVFNNIGASSEQRFVKQEK